VAVDFTETAIVGAFSVEINRHEDERGFFARTWDAAAFTAKGLVGEIAECSISYNHRRGTVRGMHFQEAPLSEAKLVRCTAGAIYDVMADLRESSPSYLEWHAVELHADRGDALYIPPGVAHGFQTLCDDSEVEYLISVPYQEELSRGIRWDDPTLGIHWPMSPSTLSARDAALPTLELIRQVRP
jgi:dTDP-4-dehydrorhamnose 3,5-epimerase